jgi:polyisoprenoid-binding protein YceI
MKRHVPFILTLFTWAGVAAAQPAVELQPGAQLAIDGTSTVRSFTCKAGVVKARLTPGEAGGSLVPEQLATALREVRLEVAAGQLDCANETMNEHMLKALKAPENPTILFQMSGYEAGAGKDGLVPLHIRGALSMAGASRPIELEARATPTPEGGLRVRGQYALRMTDWGVRPPTLMLGAMKVGDSVVIRFDFTLARK